MTAIFKPFGINTTSYSSVAAASLIRYTLNDVPDPHPELETYEITQRNGDITLVTARTLEIETDYALSRAQEVYFELRDSLAARYGKPLQEEHWLEGEGAWLSLITGQNQRITIWTGCELPLPHGITLILLVLDPKAIGKAEVWLQYQLGITRLPSDRQRML